MAKKAKKTVAATAKVDTGSKPAKSEKTKKPAKASKASKPSKPNIFARFGKYIKDVKSEMKRVVWPDRTEVVNSSGIVIATLIVFILFSLAVDSVSSYVIVLIGGLGT